ncbi:MULTISPECIES: LytTR family DNA-binding domain-containing protein [unclassified Spirosoma]|uniref:LytR/AlgR family response regulator transcription factor n=1 Tax=unclassified Spirosoma TaxID=2621999 RepID=UPI000961D2DD|nr:MULTISPECIES: LytTR family DNA-binding domain-containing protein [unclassified Spirosoma]MBN8821599.1 response regulator transcription factor [Spirosoma sp.]OJW78366.1 MAG: DNA-binding response regulator [Spirosoma sp. 48-14]
MIKAVIIDDEEHCRETLSMQLDKYCSDVTVVATFPSAIEGLQYLQQTPPDLLFLDIEMPLMNGFELLEKLHAISFAIIFTTGYDMYAIKAIRFSALDYLLKPIDRDDLQKAVGKLQRKSIAQMAQQIELLVEKLGVKKGRQKIALPTAHGFDVIPTDIIIRCEADDNYTHVVLKTGKSLLVSRTLKEIEELLAGDGFLRVHQSHLINLDELQRYIRGEGGYVIMSDNSSVPVSRSRKEVLLNRFN